MRPCAHPGCDKPALKLNVAYCSEECRQLAREQLEDENHIRRIFDAAELAPRPEACRNCPGGYTYTDERGYHWCMCGRNATLDDLREVA